MGSRKASNTRSESGRTSKIPERPVQKASCFYDWVRDWLGRLLGIQELRYRIRRRCIEIPAWKYFPFSRRPMVHEVVVQKSRGVYSGHPTQQKDSLLESTGNGLCGGNLCCKSCRLGANDWWLDAPGEIDRYDHFSSFVVGLWQVLRCTRDPMLTTGYSGYRSGNGSP